MQNQQKENGLMLLRQEIDEIDNQILDLLKARMSVIARVGEFKKKNGEKFFIKSNREADMIKNLIARSENKFPKELIITIWRKIITAANMMEQPLNIAIHNPNKIPDYNYLIKEYYSDIVPIFDFDSVTNVVAEIEKQQAQIGIFALPKNEENIAEPWWIALANNKSGIKVFAKIPFLATKKDFDLLAVAIKEPEKSRADNSLIYVELSDEFSKQQLFSVFKEQNISIKILQISKLKQVANIEFYLLEADGFFVEEDFRNVSKSNLKPYIKVLGHYAKI